MRKMILCAAVLFTSGVRLSAADLPKAETILDKYIAVTGGKAAYEKNHSEVSTGKMEVASQGISGTVMSYRAEPDKSYTEIEIAGIGKMREGSDGQVAWSLSAMQGPHLKEGAERTQALNAARHNAELRWREIYTSAQTAGIEQVGGKDCYKIVLTPKEGNQATRYYDKESNLLVKMTMTVHHPMGEIPVESVVGDYRKEGDLLLPHKITQTAAGQVITITIDSVQFNTEIPKDKFEIPAEIKALMKK